MVELATVPRPRGVFRAARCSNMLSTHALARVEAPPHSPAERSTRLDSGTRRCSRRRLRGHGVGRGGPTVDLSTVPSPYDGMQRVWWLGARPAAAFRSTWSELAPLSSPRVNANVNGKPLW